MIQSIEVETQVWSIQNLDVDSFRNGEKIFHAKNAKEWEKCGEQKTPAWCYYNFDGKNDKVHGKLYNWYAVEDLRSLSPKGWLIPTDDDWNELVSILSNETDDVMMCLKSDELWNESPGENSIGFNAIPSGKVDMSGNFDYDGAEAINNSCFFWTSSEEGVGGGQMLAGDKNYARYRSMDSYQINIGKSHKNCGMSIRLIKEGK
jgi:uncharacterized protein (TIGR02145 family)